MSTSMPTHDVQEDSHVLIALAARVIGTSSATRHNPFAASHNILDEYETNNKTLPILDAVAALCISQDKKQAVAVALQMDNINKTICLTIAENHPGWVEPQVVGHIHGIWGRLQQLSDYYAKPRFASDLQPTDPAAYDTSVDLVSQVSKFSWKKMRKCIKKWWPYLPTFGLGIARYIETEDMDLEETGLERCFVDGYLMLEDAVGMMENKQTPDLFSHYDWEVFTDTMDTAVLNVVKVLEDKNKCEEWDRRFRRGANDPPVRRTLEKLTTLHRHIVELIDFAKSPRRRQILQYKLIIEVVAPPQPQQVSLPSSENAWKTIIENLCTDEQVLTGAWLDRDAADLASHYSQSTSYSCPIHCECSLIAHLEKNRDAQNCTPAFSYIGVSKLSCLPCSLWICAFNKRGGRQYRTRGSHGKWCWPWGAPPGLKFDTAALTTYVQAEYLQFMQAAGRFKPRSNGPTSGPTMSPEAIKRIENRLKTKRAMILAR